VGRRQIQTALSFACHGTCYGLRKWRARAMIAFVVNQANKSDLLTSERALGGEQGRA